MLVNVVSLIVSIVALTVSGLLALRQLRSAQSANVLAMILNGFSETRDPGYTQAIEYVLYRLRDDYPQPISYLAFAEPHKAHVRRVGLFFDDLGKLVAHGVVDEKLIIGAYGRSVLRAWTVLAPFIYQERSEHQRTPFRYFEDLAHRVHRTSPDQVYARLQLGQLPPPPAGHASGARH
ncbi:hypothetical protein [Streptomyces sp. NRRL S-87]|uniref:DUF4760 domain-containing protein n=1 Tax=Streptomyces sp. NRRL S-87 TaxID=1463920 RepID=UPI0004C17574|nr:hypothetical protein [Streptomyces sp. NRRL S-87]